MDKANGHKDGSNLSGQQMCKCRSTFCRCILMLCTNARECDLLIVLFNFELKGTTVKDTIVSMEFLDDDTM